MPSPGLAYANSLQNQERFPKGFAYGEFLDEVIRCIPFVKAEGAGESMVVPQVAGSTANAQMLSLAAFRAAASTPTTGDPTISGSVTYTFQRIDSLSEDDPTLADANSTPNNIYEVDVKSRNVALLRKLALGLMQGDNTTTGGFLGWENRTSASRTDVTKGDATAAGILESLLIIDDTCETHCLGNRASAFVTTALGRRNIERAAQSSGFTLEYKSCHGLENEVPYYRGRPILVSGGLANDGGLNEAPLYAADFSYVFMLATTGDPDDFCIESRQMPLQSGALQGTYQWFHGACVVRQPAALVRTLITTTVSG